MPRTARTRFIRRTPSSKSPPSSAVIAARSMFPTAWPPRLPGSVSTSPLSSRRNPGNRYPSSSLMSGSASASAAMQLRMSPTGGMPSSSRSAPDDPPSSATVTIAVRLLECSLRPRRRLDRPVPPPMATIRGPRASWRFWYRTSASGRTSSDRSGCVRLRTTRHAPMATSPTPTPAAARPRMPTGRNCSVRMSVTVSATPPGSTSCETCRIRCAAPTASRTRPANITRSQRLTPMPGWSQRRKPTTLTSAPARDGRPRRARVRARAIVARAPRRRRSSGGGRPCSRCRS